MNKDMIKKVLASNPVARPAYFRRPHWTRRGFFRLAGAGLTASFLAKEAKAQSGTCTSQGMSTLNTAKNVIFILMAGAPSHVDTFDFKNTVGVTPAAAAPQTVNGGLWPTGILPKLSAMTSQFSVIRSLQAHALVHSLGQTWVQIGRNPAAALGNIAPNIGSIVAMQMAAQRQPSHVLPTFLALNSDGGVSSGYLDATYAPFKVDPTTAGLPNATNSLGQARWQEMYNQMHAEDDALRVNSPMGQSVVDMDNLYSLGTNLMYNPQVQSVFTYSSADSTRYGGSSFGNALVVAKQALASNMGTRFIQVTIGGWDMHIDIYGEAQNKNGTNIFSLGKQFDAGVSALMGDLQAAGLLDSTLIVACGEFGRTPNFTAALGRDHWLNQFAFFAGGGVQGGRIIGATDANGANIVDPGWSQKRAVNPEDIEATIYSALGIDWTTICYNDPFHRGFEFVPQSLGPDFYNPVNELFK
ncbi:MAG TPA: DUF1501 domain-containing protein [Bryobacteraceae bacterium]|nr:DUF1501 domain-containing protein [Bryobacteraceae bacterium]